MLLLPQGLLVPLTHVSSGCSCACQEIKRYRPMMPYFQNSHARKKFESVMVAYVNYNTDFEVCPSSSHLLFVSSCIFVGSPFPTLSSSSSFRVCLCT